MSAVLPYVIRRVVLAVPVLLGVATLVFSLIHLVPGDPAQAMLGEGASPQDMAELRSTLGLDRRREKRVARHFRRGAGHARAEDSPEGLHDDVDPQVRLDDDHVPGPLPSNRVRDRGVERDTRRARRVEDHGVDQAGFFCFIGRKHPGGSRQFQLGG